MALPIDRAVNVSNQILIHHHTTRFAIFNPERSPFSVHNILECILYRDKNFIRIENQYQVNE